MSVEVPRLRVAVVGIVVVSLFAALFARLYYLQILSDTTLEAVRGGPVYREVAYQGTRGRILDREGRVLVDNRESITVTIDRRQFEAVDDQDALVLRLARALNSHGVATKVTDIRNRLADLRYDQFKPVPIAEDVSPDLEGYLLERLFEFPSVDVARVQVRTYPYGSIAAHVLGYTGAISGDELAARPKDEDPKAYEPGDDIGKAGIERVFEPELRATPGKREIEVDARNVEIGTRATTPPQPGNDLQLTIDLDLQQAVEVLLGQSLADARQQRKNRPTDPDLRAPAGAVVVLDAKTSEVLALASYPTYNPAEFIGGISEFRFSELNDPASFFPFKNRAVQETYSPGSTFKPFTAVAALSAGVQSAEEVIRDRGSYELEDCSDTCVFSNANGTAYGNVDLRKSLVVSSDVYFYRLGEQFWVRQAEFGKTAIQDTARRFGLGSPTGIQLPYEERGLISDPDIKKARHDENPDAFPYGEWFTGDNVNLAIGQGDVAVTPLQLANAYAALANGGQLTAPTVARALLDHDSGAPVRTFESRALGRVDLPAPVRQPIIDGLEGAVDDPSGTAFEAFGGFPSAAFKVAGKTGTAEAPPRADTSIFASFGPVEDPRYVVVTVMEESGFAADTAAPLARKVYEQLDQVRPHLPATTTPASTSSTTPPAEGEGGEQAAEEDAAPDEVAAPPTTPVVTTTATTAPATTTTEPATAPAVESTTAPTSAPPPAGSGLATTEAAVARDPARPAAAPEDRPTTTAGGP
jgi:penicillin-binding protein 2